jgi:hypothetical protein
VLQLSWFVGWCLTVRWLEGLSVGCLDGWLVGLSVGKVVGCQFRNVC